MVYALKRTDRYTTEYYLGVGSDGVWVRTQTPQRSAHVRRMSLAMAVEKLLVLREQYPEQVLTIIEM